MAVDVRWFYDAEGRRAGFGLGVDGEGASEAEFARAVRVEIVRLLLARPEVDPEVVLPEIERLLGFGAR